MKILSFEIKNYKLFQDFKIDFHPDENTFAIIGKNGSGKSTFVECLSIIFSNLFGCSSLSEVLKLKYPFEFELKYLLKKDEKLNTKFDDQSFSDYVGIELSFSNSKSKIRLNQSDQSFENESIAKFLHSKGEDISYILPSQLIVYYSGISNILYESFKSIQNDILKRSKNGEIKIEQPYYYFLPEHFPNILISLLSYQFGNVPDLLENMFSISGFKKIIFNLKKPGWAHKDSGGIFFWDAKGDLYYFLEKLRDSAISEKSSGDDVVLEFTSRKQLQSVIEFCGTELKLFEYLVLIQANEFVRDISIELNKNEITLDWQRLSEGEKQRLTIFGLKELMAYENSMILLDEPDTYLHPEWQREFIQDFITSDVNIKTFFLIASHSANIVSGLNRNQLKIFRNENNIAKLRKFSFNPYGKKVDDILIDFFDLDGLRLVSVEKDIGKLQKLVVENKYETKEFLDLYSVVSQKIGPDDLDLLSINLEIAKRKKKKDEKNK